VRGLEKISGVRFWCKDLQLHSGVISFVINGFTPQEVGMILNQEYQMAVRTGLHCAPMAHQLIQTIRNGGTVRVGLGWFNTSEEVNELLNAIKKISEI
jgi:selenocysteine lyase/cysteine desulfurase